MSQRKRTIKMGNLSEFIKKQRLLGKSWITNFLRKIINVNLYVFKKSKVRIRL